jgi:hypothetical protein
MCQREFFEILEIMHTDKCWPLHTHCLNGQRFFIFLLSDDHIRFIYLYLLNNKGEVLNVFNTYMVERTETTWKENEDHKI